MIVLNLSCTHGHRFEGWFGSRDAFDTQNAGGLVQCTFCQSSEISAMPSAPYVHRDVSNAPVVTAAPQESVSVQTPTPQMAEQLFKALATMARQAENVGERFPEEARRIHYQETESRNIRGIATRDEARELLEEGILVLPAPVPAEGETH
jgi:hypothetical protein